MYPPTLASAIAAIPEPYRAKFLEHLDGDTSADWMSEWSKRFGAPVSATTIRVHRRRSKESQ